MMSELPNLCMDEVTLELAGLKRRQVQILTKLSDIDVKIETLKKYSYVKYLRFSYTE